jgi:hypothetical protein
MSSPGLTIQIGITARLRADADRWRETKTYTESWNIDSTLEDYGTAVDAALPGIWTYVQTERDKGALVSAHYSVRLQNITAATPPAGAWVQAKQHYDGALAAGDLTNASILAERISHAVAAMRKLAKY